MRPNLKSLPRYCVHITAMFLLSLGLPFTSAEGFQHSEKKQIPKLKIYVLAGQSNMEGKGSVAVIKNQLKDSSKKGRFHHLTDGDDWKSRKDVRIHYLGGRGRRTGDLTVGYGISQKNSVRLIGPELGFGWTVGDHYNQPVLIIKTAWGGKSIDRDFRPPSRGLPDSFSSQLTKAQKRNPKLTHQDYEQTYGHFFRQMTNEVKQVTSDLKKYVPNYQGEGYEIAGFVWFQGWNDQYAPTSVQDYQENLTAMILDLQKEWNQPNLKIVIGAMGHDGVNQKGKVKQIADAQVAVSADARFKDRIHTIRTSKFWDTEAQAAYKKYWRDKKNRDIEKWRHFGDDHGYHYFGSPNFFLKAGNAFGEAMIQLEKK